VEECCGAEDRDGLIERARSLLSERGAPLTDDRERSRALGFLTRKGFEYEVAYDAIRAARTE
jgi:SOS response regulatory protein OraA/RecX